MFFNEIFLSSLFAGSIAGLTVDLTLFPLDTIKTRLQASEGFRKSGGFRHVYKGLGPQAIGSAPMAAIFFATYETCKHWMETVADNEQQAMLVHMSAASTAEFCTCLLKVPIEIVKQRQQTTNRTGWEIACETYRSERYIGGFYRGFLSTLLREIPFALVQFPAYEYFKRNFVENNDSKQVAVCGALAGGLAAAVTTPLDVAKTRIMLATKSSGLQSQQLTVSRVLHTIYTENGIKGLFAGFVPRVYMISLGGAIFFGSYNVARTIYAAG